ncbi:methylenetetrahydrofolate reductase 1 isoform X2 [Apis laboriosa]|uniref:methylenetetrahydrofolate reductase 1 isoform X2 n=1 Tax=Apis laboriosa TaxID=183418 RepID=UPI001CC7F001|nr:methylenetetrahydrofolate reductase 1 isoform X2 [Apis laboriosa]
MTKTALKRKTYNQYIDNRNGYQSKDTEHEIVDLRNKLKNVIDTNTIFCSFEFMHVENNDFYKNFFMEMNKYHPLFYALTWKHMKNEIKNYLSSDMYNVFPNNILLHLTSNDLTCNDVKIILKKTLDRGIRNIFVLKDSSNPNSEFPYAVDLVRFIRNQFGEIFCICVAGYPEMHPKSLSKEMDLVYLKEKVDAGADFIITQIFFEANIFIKFVNDCKQIGINVPIIPGIFPIPNYTCFQKMAKICNVKIPQIILNDLQCIKDNDEEVRIYGIELLKTIIKDIIASTTTCGFHFFTLNKPSLSSDICDKLGIFY